MDIAVIRLNNITAIIIRFTSSPSENLFRSVSATHVCRCQEILIIMKVTTEAIINTVVSRK